MYSGEPHPPPALTNPPSPPTKNPKKDRRRKRAEVRQVTLSSNTGIMGKYLILSLLVNPPLPYPPPDPA